MISATDARRSTCLAFPHLSVVGQSYCMFYHYLASKHFTGAFIAIKEMNFCRNFFTIVSIWGGGEV